MCVAAFAGGGSASGQGPEEGVGGQKFCEERFEYFNDFIVHIKGVHKKDRILVCDVVIELNRGAKLSKEMVELRRIIYKTLKELFNLPGIRRKLKKEIEIRSNNFMDDEIIKNVYFTRFVLL